MRNPVEQIRGDITNYDERTGTLTIVAHYDDFATMVRREYGPVTITLHDSRPLSGKQRRSCYAMLGEISEWSGSTTAEVKEILKLEFWTAELWQTADTLFSLSDAPMSIVAAFQSWLARFIVSNDVPTKKPMLGYVDDVKDYVYACLAHKKCCICGRAADLHHVDRVGMGRDRTDIVHEGMEVLPLCREHHTEAHTMPDSEFFAKYHLESVTLDKALCKIYGLKTNKNRR